MVGTAGLDAGSSCLWLDWPLSILYFLCLLCSKRLKCLSLKLLPFILFPYPASGCLQEFCSTWYFVLSRVFGRDMLFQLHFNSLFGDIFNSITVFTSLQSGCVFSFGLSLALLLGTDGIQSITTVWTAKCSMYLFHNDFSWQGLGHYLAIDWYLCLQMVKPQHNHLFCGQRNKK